MTEYTQIPLEQYLEREQIVNLPQEVKDEIIDVRQNLDYMAFPIYQELIKIGVLKRKVKLKHPRSLYVKENEVIYFNTFNGRFETVATFIEETNETV